MILNGPRYFLIDRVALANPGREICRFGGLEMRRLATVPIPLRRLAGGMKARPYTEVVVNRTTTYCYDASREIYQLVSTDGTTYVMQAYSLIVDPHLTESALLALGERLSLPTGWSYRVETLTEERLLTVNGKAHLIQDDLTNSHERVGWVGTGRAPACNRARAANPAPDPETTCPPEPRAVGSWPPLRLLGAPPADELWDGPRMTVDNLEHAGLTLFDGTSVLVRPIQPSDLEALQRFHLRLSQHSIYLRFFGIVPELSDDRARYFTHVDGVDRFALVAVEPSRPDEIIAVTRFDRDPNTAGGEYACIVEDRWQGRGLGLAVTRCLIEAARRRGYRAIFALVLPENVRMVNLLKDLGMPERVRWVEGVQRIEVDISMPEKPAID